ncbi:ankyrin repeat domain-containing protein 26-like [Dreissena polymorpha]|nr:ankyrin repeat domain-containing protein 26-like [Dreissena polymorpha]
MKKIKGIFGIGASKSSSKQSSFNVHGYDIKEKDLPKLHKAAWTGDLAKVKQLAKKDPSALDKENRTPMHLACVQGHTDIVNELLAWNARTDAGDSQARTPLMKAVECNQEGCVEVLLERKKDLNLKDADHNTALHLAVLEAPAKVVAMLINGGADVNIKNKDGLTPLMLSVHDPTKRDDMTRLLLEGGANPNAVDNNKKTALHHACMEDNINHVKLLLQHRADTTLKDSKGWTAEDCAMMKAHHGCCQIIFDHNLKTRPRNSLGGSVPNTPRGAMGSISSNISATHTPRGVDSVTEPSSDLFGHPQGHQDADEDSDDPTMSQSKGEGRQDSWADDTDVSSAMDDHKLKGKVKVSLAGRVNLSDDDDVEREVEYENTRKPGGITRPMLSRTPTPDADLRDSPQVMNGPKTSSPSKIPVKKQPSGASNTSVDEDVLDDSDEDGEDIRRRVSFSNKQDVRNITDEDDTDIEDEEEEEEEAVPSKRPKMANPQDEADGYVPTATTSAAAAAGKLSQDKFQDDDYVNTERAMMRDLGLQGADDDLQDISDDYDDEDDEEEVDDEGDLSEGHSDRQQPSTPRGILKKSENGRPPSNQRPVESDTRRMLVQAEIHPVAGPYPQEEEESAWDTSGPSEGNQSTGNQAGNMRHMDSPEVDSDLENTLNPERSQAEKISSQWDSTDDGYTPRDGSSKVHKKQDEIEDEDDFDDDEDYEDHKQKAADDHIHEVVTSFSTASPLPSDSPPRPGSHDTSTGSTSAQRTVVAKETVVVKETKQTEPADDDEDWDSEDEDISDEDYGGHLVVGVPGYPGAYSPVVGEVADTPPLGMDPPRPGMDSPAVEPTTPRTARDHTTSTVSDEESMSEWEKEHRQAKEAEKLRELEEEEERQRQWDEEEERRQRQLEREAQEELERERSQEFSDSDFSDDGDHLPDSAHQPLSDHSHPSQNAVQHSADSPQVSLTSPRARELKKPPPKLQVTRFIKPAPLSPRAGRTPVQLGEIENESPAQFGDHESPSPRNVRQLAAPGKMNQHVPKGMYYDDDSDVEVEEIEEEVSNDLDMPSPRKEFPGDSPVEEFQEDSPTMNVLNKAPERDSSERKFHVEYPQRESPVGRFQNGGQDGEFSSDDDIENAVMPATREEQVKETVVVAQSTSRVMAATSLPASRTESVLPSESFKADGNESPLLGIPPPLPVSAPPGNQKAMSLRSDGQSADDDEVELDQPVRGPKGYVSSLSQFPDLSGTTGLYRSGLDVPFDDDGLSVTSTENGDISSSYRPENLPYGKDMLVNMNLNDSSAVLKLQEHLREHRKQLEYERSQKNILEEKQRQMTKDRAGLQKSLDSLKYQKSVLEQNKLDFEAKIRQLEYQVSDEEEKKKNAELLLKKTKEQLSKKEGQYTQEMEARQRAELSMRNVQMELRAAQNQMKDLEDEKVELERKLTNEISARQLQEQINEEQQRLQQHIHEESQLNSSQRESEAGEEARTALELADDDIKHTRDLVEKYKNEIIALKAELQKQRQRLTEDNSTLSAENDKLQGRCEDLRSELKDHEEALTQYTLQQNLHQQKLSSDINMLRDSLDKEHLAREKNEAELDSLRSRLQTTSSQLEKSQQTRNEIEKRLHSDRDEWARQLERKEAELSSMKDKVQAHIHALNSLETKLNSVENELQISNTSLLERTNQYHQAQREMQHYKTVHDNHDVNMRHEKEMNNKLQAKVESLQDRYQFYMNII